MASRIRVIEHKPAPSFAERLEAKAEALIHQARPGDQAFSITWTLEREVALTLSHIHQARSLHRALHRNLLRQECYLDTEIMQRMPRPHQYVHDHLSIGERLRDRLRELEKERRHLAAIYVEKLQVLHDRLLILLNRHALLRP